MEEYQLTACCVQTQDAAGEWSSPLCLSQAKDSFCSDIYCDKSGRIWALYHQEAGLREPATTKEGTCVQTSEDGYTWSRPKIIARGSCTAFFQRRNGEYALFFVKGDSNYFMFSSEGIEWSRPQLVSQSAHLHLVDAAESDDSTIWAAFDGKDGVYLSVYTDTAFLEDFCTMRTLRIKNGITACGIALLIGFYWVLFERSPLPRYIKIGKDKLVWKEEFSNKMKVVVVILFVFFSGCCYAVNQGLLCFVWLFSSSFYTIAVIVLALSTPLKDQSVLYGWAALVLLHWSIALLLCRL